MLSVWAYILVASTAIGLFFIASLLTGRRSNPLATYLFAALLLVLTASNIDNWLYASGLWRDYPTPVGFSRASVLLIGPLILFYARSIVDPNFRLSPTEYLQFLPYIAVYAALFPQLFLCGEEFKLDYIRYSYENMAKLDFRAGIVFLTYILHYGLYLAMTLKLVYGAAQSRAGKNFITPTRDRLRWLKSLSSVFGIYFAILAFLLTWAVASGTYRVEINIYLTTAYSLILYYLGYRILREDRSMFPGFEMKYRSLNVAEDQRGSYLTRLVDLMESKKLFLDPDLNLARLAGEVEIPPGHLSRLINEEFGRNFADFVNSYRVEEVKKYLQNPQYDSLSILGIAMEVGFNSKSSFNSAFKKFTGATPSDFKKS